MLSLNDCKRLISNLEEHKNSKELAKKLTVELFKSGIHVNNIRRSEDDGIDLCIVDAASAKCLLTCCNAGDVVAMINDADHDNLDIWQISIDNAKELQDSILNIKSFIQGLDLHTHACTSLHG